MKHSRPEYQGVAIEHPRDREINHPNSPSAATDHLVNTHRYFPRKYQVSDQPPERPNRILGHQDGLERLLSGRTDIDFALCDDH
jgi:hypothetical protein